MFAYPGDRSGISGGTAQYSFGSDLLDFRTALAYEIVLRLLAQVRSFAANVNTFRATAPQKLSKLLDCLRNCWTAPALKRREQGPESPHCICPSRSSSKVRISASSSCWPPPEGLLSADDVSCQRLSGQL